ncbi:MAG: lamin tail domain-containing protein [Sedimentisphaerales bacterium]|nr:lamin tail domain-containing protein [Sedimentisphaerales bacterium]
MMMTRSALVAATLAVLLHSVAVRAAWVAYNDCLHQDGDSTAANVTRWTIHSRDQSHFTGRLVNFQTGSDAGMPTVTFTVGGAGLQVSSGSSGGNFAAGTDAYAIFNGIVDFGPDLVYYGDTGWWVEMEFTGLDPKCNYTFVGAANRSRSYPTRVSLFTILDADSFMNNSSVGVVARQGAVTKLLAGDNTGTGYVVRWDGIMPSARGTFRVRAEAAPEAEGGLAYPFGGFMLQQTSGTANRPPDVDAGEYDALVWPMHTIQLRPSVSDDDPCGLGILEYKWSQISGPGAVTFSPSDNVAEAVAVFPKTGEYELMLRVWDDLPQETNATVKITVIQPLFGDFNGDNDVNWRDLLLFTKQWLDPVDSPADLDITHGADFRDFAIAARNWRIGEGPTLVINEVLARNDLNSKDPQGEYEDWIELYNGGEETVDVGGMYLTDDPCEPRKWRFPTGQPLVTRIPPGKYLLVWADNDLAASGLHAGFEIDVGGGDIALFDASGSVPVDHIRFDSQVADVSFGREPDGAPNWVTLTPTPGASNNGSFLAVVADTKFSHDRGFCTEPFDVTITTATDGAIIRYTTDGSAPTPSYGTIYTTPVRIAATTALRAMAYRPGWKSTNVDTHTYIFLDDVIRQATDPATGVQVTPPGCPTSWGSAAGDYQMDPDVVGQDGRDIFAGLYARTIVDDLKAVPTISLVMNKDDWFGSKGIYINQSQDGTERVASFEFIDPAGNESIQVNCALAMQGGVSGGGTSLGRWKTFKLSMRPRFKTQTDDGKPTGGPPKLENNLFHDSPVERLNTVVLDSVLNHSWLHPGSDQQRTALYVQDQYVSDLHNAMGGHSGHGFYAHVYIDGLYWGLYYIHERPDHAWAAEVFGGDEDEYDAIKHNSGGVINNGTGGSATANFNAMLAAANAVSSDPTNLAKYEALRKLLDVNDVATYLLANWFCGNHDWPGKNWYATHRNTPDGRWRFHSWDAEHTLEGTNDVGESPSDLHSRLAKSAEYRQQFADLIHRYFFNGGPLTCPAAADLFKVRTDSIDRAIVGESARWGDNRQSRPYTRQDWVNTVNAKLNTMFPNRSRDVLNWLKAANLYPAIDAPEFLVNVLPQHGGHIQRTDLLILGPSAGIVYYTLDGADPRLPGGSLNTAHVLRFSTAITLDHSARIKMRAYAGTQWSAMCEAVFAVGPVAESLRISEIMYHPSDPNAEFIELTNVGTDRVNLNLVKFTNGVDFTFPSFDLASGGYCLVAQDTNALRARHGASLPIAGQYAGSLNNAGERIELLDAAGTTIHNFRFDDHWFDDTDGPGYSLTVKDPRTADPNTYESKSVWRPSTRPGGSPGTGDNN